jgi:hypothetical protein
LWGETSFSHPQQAANEMAEPCVQRASYVWHPLQDQDGGLSSVSIMLFASLKDKISFLASDSLTLIAQISIRRKTSRPAGCHEEVRIS